MRKLFIGFAVVFASCGKPCYECSKVGVVYPIEICGNQATSFLSDEYILTWEVESISYIKNLTNNGYKCRPSY
jgi:hypothetical protein